MGPRKPWVILTALGSGFVVSTWAALAQAQPPADGRATESFAERVEVEVVNVDVIVTDRKRSGSWTWDGTSSSFSSTAAL